MINQIGKICLSTDPSFSFSRVIFISKVRRSKSSKKFKRKNTVIKATVTVYYAVLLRTRNPYLSSFSLREPDALL